MSASWCRACGRYHWAGACAPVRPVTELLAGALSALLAEQVRLFARLLRESRESGGER